MSLKVNKSAFVHIQNEISADFISKLELEMVNGKFEAFSQRLEAAEGKALKDVEAYKKQMDEYVYVCMSSQIDGHFQKYKDVSQRFEAFFNQEELGSMIDRKADVELIKRLQSEKANKAELDCFHQNLTSINDKMQHMAVFTSELANLLLPKNPGKFSSDLQQTLLKREQVAHLG